MSELVFDQVSVRLGGQPALAGVSLTLRPGQCVGLIGPNGAGKTTLLRAGVGLIRPDDGSIRLDGQDPACMPPLQRARQVAYLAQSRPLAWPMRVAAVVALGRFSYGAGLGPLGTADAAAVARALAACDLTALADRPTDSLSGGELARVHIARALASEAPILLADEPTAALDPRHGFEVMTVLRNSALAGRTVLVTVHDLSLAARFCDRLVLLAQGAVMADGTPAAVLTPAHLEACFGVRGRLGDNQTVQISGLA